MELFLYVVSLRFPVNKVCIDSDLYYIDRWDSTNML